MAHYVDGFLLVVPTETLPAYRKLAQTAARVWLEHGALEYRECIGDQLVDNGCPLPFTKLTKAKPEETVVFAWIVYKSRKSRDAILKKVMADPRMQDHDPAKMPFDVKRMSWGGFKTIVDQVSHS